MKTSVKIASAGVLGLALGVLVGWQASAWKYRAAAQHTAAASPAPVEPAPPSVEGLRSTTDAQEKGPAARKGQSDSLRRLIKQVTTVVNEKNRDSVLDPFSLEQFADYLERHQRDAKSLLAVYAFTHDKALLREAYEKYPENLLVAEKALDSLDLSTDEKLVLLEKVRAAHPNNALGDLMTANVLLADGKKEEFMRSLQSGLGKTSLDYGEREQRLALREALMAAGKSPIEARVLSWTRHSTLFYEVHNAAGSGIKEMRQMLKDGREEEVFALAGPMLALGQRMEQKPGANMMTELIALTVQGGILKSLPDDVEIGDTGQTAGQLFQQVEERGKKISGSAGKLTEGMNWHLQNFDEAGIELYFQIAEERGERAAMEWAESYHGPAPASQK